MSIRKKKRELARWETATRHWATAAARDLAVSLYREDALAAKPYRIGVVLGPQESAWVECPASFTLDAAPSSTGIDGPAPYRPWLVTSERIVGRLGDNRLYGYRWDSVFGCRVNLKMSEEYLSLDVDGLPPMTWRGPAIAPMAVAAVYRLHGIHGLIEHPGLISLRVPPLSHQQRPRRAFLACS
jgi:hypothetical protein